MYDTKKRNLLLKNKQQQMENSQATALKLSSSHQQNRLKSPTTQQANSELCCQVTSLSMLNTRAADDNNVMGVDGLKDGLFTPVVLRQSDTTFQGN